MAFSLTSHSSKTMLAQRTPRPRAMVMRLVAQSAPVRQEERPREVTASSTGTLAITQADVLAPKSTTGLLDQLAQLFGLANTTRQEEEEWYREIGHLLEAAEKHGSSGHSMYGSHLAERLAVEPVNRT